MRNRNNMLGMVGQFSTRPKNAQVCLSTGDHQFPLNETEWFNRIAPQMWVSTDARIRLGGQIFNSRRLGRIAGAKAPGRAAPITATSMLLDLGGNQALQDPFKRFQNIGAKITKELVESLQVLAMFRDPSFDVYLLKLGVLALAPVSNEWLRRKHASAPENVPLEVIDDIELRRMFSRSHAAPHTLLGYLKCVVEDEENLLGQFRSAIQNQNTFAPICIEALVLALQKIKHRLSAGTQIGSNVAEPLDTLATADNLGWLQDCYDNHSESIRGLIPRQVFEANVGKRSFQALYRKFQIAHEQAQRIVRTDLSHPFINAFFFSKYLEHSQTGILGLAKTAYEIGVASQPAPLPVITMETRHRLRTIIQGVLRREPDPELCGDKNFFISREFLSRSLNSVPEFDSAVTKNSLIDWHREHTIKGLSFVGGAIGQMVQTIEGHNQSYKPLLRILLASKPQEGQTLYETARRNLLSIAASHQRGFIQRVFDRVEHTVDRVEEVVDAFVHTLAEDSDQLLQEGFAAQQREIRAEANLNDAITLLHLHLQVCSIGDNCGAAHALTPDMLNEIYPAEAEELDSRLQAWVDAAKLKLNSKLPRKLVAPLPDSLEALPSGQQLRLTNQSMHVGNLKRDDDTLVIETVSPDTAAFIASENTVIEIDGHAFLQAGQGLSPILANVRGLEAFDPFHLQQSGLSSLVEQYNRLAEQRHALVQRIISSEKSDVATELRSSQRVITMIEAVLTSPESMVALGTADLSQGLGLVIAMMATVDPTDPGFFDNKPSPITSERLARLDLSNFLTAQDVHGMARGIGFVYAQCQSVDSIRTYLQEIREQAEFAKVAPIGISVLYVNQTLQAQNLDPTTENLFFSEHQPLIVYLTRQAFEDVDNAPAEFNAFSDRLIRSIGMFPVRIPIFISNIVISNSETAVPVIDPRTKDLPAMVVGRRGSNQASEAVVVDRALQSKPYLALAASLLSPTGEFGSLATSIRKQAAAIPGESEDSSRVYADIPDALKIDLWPGSLGVVPNNEDVVARLLHSAWFAAPHPTRTGCHLLSELVTTLAINLAIAESYDTQRSLAASFGHLLKNAIHKPGRLAQETIGLPPVVARLLNALQVKRQNAWGPIPSEGNSTTLMHDYRAQIENLQVTFSSSWVRKLHERLASLSAPVVAEPVEEGVG